MRIFDIYNQMWYNLIEIKKNRLEVKTLKNIKYSSLFLIISALSIMLFAGCSVGIRPAYYDLPPIDQNQNPYGVPAYNEYYSPQTNYKYEYSSSYDPWTMGNYYDNYTPPSRVSRDSQASSNSSDSSSSIGERRPSVQNRGTESPQNTMAPQKQNTRREKIAQRDKSGSNSDADIPSSRKERREPSNNSSSSNSEIQNNQSNTNFQQQTDTNKDDEEQKKQKHKRGIGNN